MRSLTAAVGLLFIGSSLPVQAAVVISLDGALPIAMPYYADPADYYFAGPATFGPITYSSTNGGDALEDPSVFGFLGGYGYGANGTDSGTGPPLAGLNHSVGTMTFAFANPVRGVLAEINWALDPNHEWIAGASAGQNIRAEIFDDADNLLEALILSEAGISNVVQPGKWGFLRPTADIASLRLTNGYITARDFSVLQSDSAVPEPSAWAMMIVGFGLIAGAMRRRQRQTVHYRFI